MKNIKISKILNGEFPIIQIVDKSVKTGMNLNRKYKEFIYEIINIPDDTDENKFISQIDYKVLKHNRSIINYSEITEKK